MRVRTRQRSRTVGMVSPGARSNIVTLTRLAGERTLPSSHPCRARSRVAAARHPPCCALGASVRLRQHRARAARHELERRHHGGHAGAEIRRLCARGTTRTHVDIRAHNGARSRWTHDLVGFDLGHSRAQFESDPPSISLGGATSNLRGLLADGVTCTHRVTRVSPSKQSLALVRSLFLDCARAATARMSERLSLGARPPALLPRLLEIHAVERHAQRLLQLWALLPHETARWRETEHHSALSECHAPLTLRAAGPASGSAMPGRVRAELSGCAELHRVAATRRRRAGAEWCRMAAVILHPARRPRARLARTEWSKKYTRRCPVRACDDSDARQLPAAPTQATSCVGADRHRELG